MKKIYLLFLIFIVFSCKSAPKNKITDDPGLSQLDLTKEKTQAAQSPGFSDEPPLNMTQDTSADDSFLEESALVQDGIPDGSAVADTSETKTDDLADAQNNEQNKSAEAVEEKKSSAGEVKPPASLTAVQPPSAPPARPVQPPPAAVKEEPPPAKTQEEAPAAEKPADEKQEAQSESEEPPPPPPARYQPWITPPPAVSAVKDDAPVPNKQVLIPPKEENVFSRIVRAAVGQLVEIPFRGNNWSYLEDIVSRRGIAYMSRRVDSEGMTFTFRAEETGIFTLRFYRRDYIRDYILYDYVQVIVEEQPDKGSAGAVNPSIDRGKVTAEPRWPSALEEAEMLRGGARPASAAEPSTSNKNSSPSSQVSSANRDLTAAPSQRTTSQASSANRDSAPAQGTTAPPQTASSNRETQTQGTGAAPQAATPQVVTPSALTQQPVTTPADAAPPAEKKEKLPPEEI